jgi:uroporphyrinogen decarboxylase
MILFENREQTSEGKTKIPVWFMRQAGRYHNHYQGIKKNSDFMTMCKNPELAAEITMGPINDFNFDAAILFSDLLFPLEQLNMGLSYHSGPPTLEWNMKDLESLNKLKVLQPAYEFYRFQAEALKLLKDKLPHPKTLLGFVGAPFTLYTYACEGGHAGNLTNSKLGFYDGRFDRFMDTLLPELEKNMDIQAEGGADALCLFDTAVGELTLPDFKHFIVPRIKDLTAKFKKKFPHKKIIYYSKLTHLDYLKSLEDDNIDVLGIDWRHSLKNVLLDLGKDYYIQGNIDPSYLHLPWSQLERYTKEFWNNLTDGPDIPLHKWICGLGHGVLKTTPEDNVRSLVKYVHENFVY